MKLTKLFYRVVGRLRRKYGEWISPKIESVLFESEDVFLSRLSAELRQSVLQEFGEMSAESLLSHFRARVGTHWPKPPTVLTDLRLDLSRMSDDQIISRAKAALEGDIHPSGLRALTHANGQVNWHANPSDSREWLLMMHRHSWWVLWGLAYQRTGDDIYAEAFVAQFKHWVVENPLPKIKSEHNSAWRLMEVGLRARNSWIPAFQLFFNSPLFDDASKLLMLRSLYDHGQMLFTFFTNRNHLVRESNGLLALGLSLPEFADASSWIEVAAARLNSELKLQVNEDGSQIEMSVGYQWLSVDEFGVTAKLLRESDRNVEIAKLDGTLAKMIEHLAIVSRPDGSFPQLNDGFILWDAESLASVGRDLAHSQVEYIGSRGESGILPEFTSRSLPNAGLHIMRSDWTDDSRWLIFDTGPYGGPHGHEDKLSFELFAFGAPFIVDPGSYTYNRADPYRAYFVGSQGHNTVLVDQKSQIRRWSPEHLAPEVDASSHGIWQSADQFDFASGQYAESYAEFAIRKPENAATIDDVTHRRDVVFSKPDFWVVVDHINAAQQHRYDFLFHLAPDIVATVRPDSSVHLQSENNGAQLLLLPISKRKLNVDLVTGGTSPIQGWYSEDHHKKCPAPTLNFHLECESDLTITWVLYPMPSGADSTVIETSMEDSDNDELIEFELRNRALTHSISIARPSLEQTLEDSARDSEIVITNRTIGKAIRIPTSWPIGTN